MTSTGTVATTWNGGICGTCGARYLGSHACSQADILRKVQQLLDMLDGDLPLRSPCRDGLAIPQDRTAGCPCRPENGGSGVCGCILGGPQVTS